MSYRQVTNLFLTFGFQGLSHSGLSFLGFSLPERVCMIVAPYTVCFARYVRLPRRIVYGFLFSRFDGSSSPCRH